MSNDSVDFLRNEGKDAKRDGMPETAARFCKAADELERLWAIDAKLPKTKDGVSIDDPNTLQAGPTTDAMVAAWMGWKPFLSADGEIIGWHDSEGNYYCAIADSASTWSPSTNPAHAGEARRKVEWSTVTHTNEGFSADLLARPACRVTLDGGTATVYYSEVTGKTEEEIKGKAEALATVRAIAVGEVGDGIMKKRKVSIDCREQENPLRCPSCGGKELWPVVIAAYRRIAGIGMKIRWCYDCGLFHHTDLDGKIRWCRPGRQEF